jgi:hypothetical protein
VTKLNERRKIIFAKCENIMNVKYTYYVLERYSYIYIACMFLISCACNISGLKIIRYTINQKIGKWNNLNSMGPRKRVYNQYTTHNFETVKFNCLSLDWRRPLINTLLYSQLAYKNRCVSQCFLLFFPSYSLYISSSIKRYI